MEIIEIARLYKTIKRYYPTFDASTETVRDATRYLHDVPYSVAEENIDQHIMNSQFPPTIKDIRGQYKDHSSTVPGVEETYKAFEVMDEWRRKAAPMPDHVRERMREIARSIRSS